MLMAYLIFPGTSGLDIDPCPMSDPMADKFKTVQEKLNVVGPHQEYHEGNENNGEDVSINNGANLNNDDVNISDNVNNLNHSNYSTGSPQSPELNLLLRASPNEKARTGNTNILKAASDSKNQAVYYSIATPCVPNGGTLVEKQLPHSEPKMTVHQKVQDLTDSNSDNNVSNGADVSQSQNTNSNSDSSHPQPTPGESVVSAESPLSPRDLLMLRQSCAVVVSEAYRTDSLRNPDKGTTAGMAESALLKPKPGARREACSLAMSSKKPNGNENEDDGNGNGTANDNVNNNNVNQEEGQNQTNHNANPGELASPEESPIESEGTEQSPFDPSPIETDLSSPQYPGPHDSSTGSSDFLSISAVAARANECGSGATSTNTMTVPSITVQNLCGTENMAQINMAQRGMLHPRGDPSPNSNGGGVYIPIDGGLSSWCESGSSGDEFGR
jgi:hypothetical protein